MTRAAPTAISLVLTGDGLTLDDAERILLGQVEQLALAPAARKRVVRARRCLEELMATGATIYGVNTGFGKLAHMRIPPEQARQLQLNLIRSHASGVGDPLNVEAVRAMMLLRANVLMLDWSVLIYARSLTR